jgi:hypothetical protein
MSQHIDDLQTQVTSELVSPIQSMRKLKYRGVIYHSQLNYKSTHLLSEIEWGMGQPLMYRGIPHTVISGAMGKASDPQTIQVLRYRGTPYASLLPAHDLPYATD